jgi:hypothetical protein
MERVRANEWDDETIGEFSLMVVGYLDAFCPGAPITLIDED